MRNQIPIDIFRVEQTGVLWVESAATLEDAKVRIQQFAARKPGDYIVLNQLTGDKLVLNAISASTGVSQ